MPQFENEDEFYDVFPSDWDFLNPFADDEPCTDCEDDDKDSELDCDTDCWSGECTMYCDFEDEYYYFYYTEEPDCSYGSV